MKLMNMYLRNYYKNTKRFLGNFLNSNLKNITYNKNNNGINLLNESVLLIPGKIKINS